MLVTSSYVKNSVGIGASPFEIRSMAEAITLAERATLVESVIDNCATGNIARITFVIDGVTYHAMQYGKSNQNLMVYANGVYRVGGTIPSQIKREYIWVRTVSEVTVNGLSRITRSSTARSLGQIAAMVEGRNPMSIRTPLFITAMILDGQPIHIRTASGTETREVQRELASWVGMYRACKASEAALSR